MSMSEPTGDRAGSTKTRGVANVSGSVYGFIDRSWDSDWFNTYMVAGVTYQIQILGFGFDAYLVLRNGAGGAITFADAGGVDDIETITYTPSASGFHCLDAQSYRTSFANTGFYLASIASSFRDDYAASTLTSSTIRLNVATAGTLELQSDADWHAVTLSAGRTYMVGLGGSLRNGYVKVFDSVGLETGIEGTGQLTFTPTTTDTYYVEVSGNTLTDVGSYSLMVAELPTATGR